MSKISRTTLLYPDGRQERVDGGKVRQSKKGVSLWIRQPKEPDWVEPGVEVVAAKEDGSVSAAFEIKDMRRKRLRGFAQVTYRVFCDY